MPIPSKKIAVVIPAFHCEKTLESVLRRIPPATRQQLYRVIIVDDGSPDGTGALADRLAREDPKLLALHHGVNRGYAQAQKTGFRAALELGSDIVALLHSDGQLAPELLETLLAPLLEERADLVQGYRIQGWATLRAGMPIYKYLANRALTLMENLCFGMNAREFHCGYQLYSAKTLRTIPFEKLSDTFHFDGEMILMATLKGLVRADIFAPCAYRDEKSHVQLFRYGMDVLKTMIRFRQGYYHRL